MHQKFLKINIRASYDSENMVCENALLLTNSEENYYQMLTGWPKSSQRSFTTACKFDEPAHVSFLSIRQDLVLKLDMKCSYLYVFVKIRKFLLTTTYLKISFSRFAGWNNLNTTKIWRNFNISTTIMSSPFFK